MNYRTMSVSISSDKTKKLINYCTRLFNNSDKPMKRLIKMYIFSLDFYEDWQKDMIWEDIMKGVIDR